MKFIHGLIEFINSSKTQWIHSQLKASHSFHHVENIKLNNEQYLKLSTFNDKNIEKSMPFVQTVNFSNENNLINKIANIENINDLNQYKFNLTRKESREILKKFLTNQKEIGNDLKTWKVTKQELYIVSNLLGVSVKTLKMWIQTFNLNRITEVKKQLVYKWIQEQKILDLNHLSKEDLFPIKKLTNLSNSQLRYLIDQTQTNHVNSQSKKKIQELIQKYNSNSLKSTLHYNIINDIQKEFSLSKQQIRLLYRYYKESRGKITSKEKKLVNSVLKEYGFPLPENIFIKLKSETKLSKHQLQMLILRLKETPTPITKEKKEFIYNWLINHFKMKFIELDKEIITKIDKSQINIIDTLNMNEEIKNDYNLQKLNYLNKNFMVSRNDLEQLSNSTGLSISQVRRQIYQHINKSKPISESDKEAIAKFLSLNYFKPRNELISQIKNHLNISKLKISDFIRYKAKRIELGKMDKHSSIDQNFNLYLQNIKKIKNENLIDNHQIESKI